MAAPSAGWIATWPLRAAHRLRMRGAGTRAPLPRPTVSVGNLALGGRAKTPVVAALARHAIAAGLRPAVLSRGYRGGVRDRDEPSVACDSGDGPPWLRPTAARAAELGDEPAWLAAALPGVPVGVHRRRDRAADAVLASHDVDLFLLDDGFQTSVGRDVDVLMLHALRDPPFAHRTLAREGAEGLARAHVLGVLGGDDVALPDGALRLSRRPAGLRRLAGGVPVDPAKLPPVTVVAGVADPASVAALATALGLTVRDVLRPGDHRAPGRVVRARLGRRDGPVLITEKDAVGWAAISPPAQTTIVLAQELEGTEALWKAVREALGGGLSRPSRRVRPSATPRSPRRGSGPEGSRRA